MGNLYHQDSQMIQQTKASCDKLFKNGKFQHKSPSCNRVDILQKTISKANSYLLNGQTQKSIQALNEAIILLVDLYGQDATAQVSILLHELANVYVVMSENSMAADFLLYSLETAKRSQKSKGQQLEDWSQFDTVLQKYVNCLKETNQKQLAQKLDRTLNEQFFVKENQNS